MSGKWTCVSSRGLALVVCAVSAVLLLSAGLAGADETAEGGAVAGQAEQGKHPANRLARESSPYLLMHAHNPIQWYPWGPEAFEKARAEDKPVFLSVGYSSCYWCHVMEREVFSSEKIAAYMNEKYVCIKVDREERPDVDDIYMTSLIVYQQAAGSRAGGGWPLSMFLDGEGNPIAGGLLTKYQQGGRTDSRAVDGQAGVCESDIRHDCARGSAAVGTGGAGGAG